MFRFRAPRTGRSVAWRAAAASLFLGASAVLPAATAAPAGALTASASIDPASTYAAAPYGAATGDVGGSAGPTVAVTSLADTGAGSLRDAVSTPGRTVVFAVSGTISLSSQVRVASNVTVDGRGADVTLTGKGLLVSGVHDVIIRNLRVLHGVGPEMTGDAITVQQASSKVWIDHNELADFPDGLVDVTEGSTAVTISWNLLHDHGKTMLLGAGTPGGTPPLVDVTVDHNWQVRTGERNPLLRHGRFHVYDNLVEDYGYTPSSGSGVHAGCGSIVLLESETFVSNPGWRRPATGAGETGCDLTRPPALRLADVDVGGSKYLAGALASTVPGPGQWANSTAVDPRSPALLDAVRQGAGWHCIGAASGPTAATITIDPASLHATYDGAHHGVSVSTSPAGPVTSVSYVDAAGHPVVGTPIAAGAYTVTVQACDPAFSTPPVTATLVIDQAPATTTAANATRVYGGANPAFTGSASGFLAADSISVKFGTSATAASPVGSYPILPVYTDPYARVRNYAVTSSGNLSVTPAPLTVTAVNASRVVNAANPPFTATFAGFLNGDGPASLSGTLTCTTSATDSSPAGTYPITCSGLSSANYAIAYVAGTLTITPSSNVPAVTLASGGKGVAVVSWTAVAGATAYYWTLQTCSGTVIVPESKSSGFAKSVSGLAPGCYSARVQAIFSGVRQPWSAWVSATLP